MASRKEMEALITLAGRVSPSLSAALKQTQKGIGGVGSQSSLMGKTLNKGFQLAAKAAAIGTAAVGAGLTYIGIKGVNLASDLTEVQNVVDTTFGANSKSVDAWAQTALKSFGLSELSAKQYSSTMGAMLKSSGLSAASTLTMSENLTALGGDMASFYNLDPSEAFEKIRSGISGETEPLKALGINMSVANLSAYAMSKGITTAYDKMDQASQTALRYNYLLEATKDSQGDFSKTSTGFANQLRVAKTGFDQLASKIMTAALPGLTKLLTAGNSLLDGAMGNPEFIKKFQDFITSAMDSIIDLVPKAIGWFETMWPSIQNVYDIAVNVCDFICNNWPLIEPVIAGIVFAQLAFNAAAKAALIIEAVTKAIEFAQAAMIFYRDGASIATIAQWALNGAMSANVIGLLILAFAALCVGIYEVVKHWDAISTAISGAWTWFTTLITGMPDVVLWLAGPLAPLLLLIKHFDQVKDAVSGAFSAVKTFFGFGDGKKSDGTVPQAYESNPMNKFAKGGFANQASIFGEAGPEMAIPIIPGNPRSIALLNQTASMLGVSDLSLQNNNVMDASNFNIRQQAPMETPVIQSNTQNIELLNKASKIPEMSDLSLKNNVMGASNFNISQQAPMEVPLLKNPRSLTPVVNNSQTNNSNDVAPIQLIYSPTIPGGSNPEIESKLKAQAEEFKSWLEEYFAEKRRATFG